MMYKKNQQTSANLSRGEEKAPCYSVADKSSVGLPTNVGNDGWEDVSPLATDLSWQHPEEELTPEEEDYLNYWDQVWKDHPLNRGLKGETMVKNAKFCLKFDMRNFIKNADLVHKFVSRGDKKLPSANPPREMPMRKIRTKHGELLEVPDPYGTFYSELHQDPNEIYADSYSLFSYDRRTHFRFTFGNMEAALRITRPIWKTQLTYKTAKENLHFKVKSACYGFLMLMQTELNGYAAEQEEEMLKLQAQYHREFLDRQQLARADELLASMEKQEIEEFAAEQVQDQFSQIVENEEVSRNEVISDLINEMNKLCISDPPSTETGKQVYQEMIHQATLLQEEDEPMEVDPPFEGQDECKRYVNDDPGVHSSDEEDEVENYVRHNSVKTWKRVKKNYHEETTILKIMEVLRQADKSAVTCKCYSCVKAFIRRSKCCPHNQYIFTHEVFAGDEAMSIEDFNAQDPATWPKMQGDEQTLEGTSSTSGAANLTFVDERPIIADEAHTKGDITLPDLNNDIAEGRWNLKDLLTREILVDQFKWGTSAVNKSYALPGTIFADATNMITNQCRFFGFLRSGVELRIQVNGTKFHCGRLIAYYEPPTWEFDSAAYVSMSYTNFMHQFLDASVSNSAILRVPFTHLYSHFPLKDKFLKENSTITLGNIFIKNYNGLRFATGSSSELTVSVYMKLINPELHQPCVYHDTFPFGSTYVQPEKAPSANEENPIVMQGDDEGTNKRGFVLDSFIGGLATGAAKLTGGLVTGGLRALAGMVFDKPTCPLPGLPIVNKAINAPCHGAGLDDSVRLSLSPISLTETPPSIIGSTDPDFNLLTLCQIPSRMDSPTWSSGNSAGKVIYSQPVCPSYVRAFAQVNGYTIYNAPILAYISRAFCYWRGSLKMKIQVIGTQFHSGRIAIMYDPTACPAADGMPGVIIPKRNINLNWVIMDVQEQKELEVDIPFMSVRPWLRCDNFRGDVNRAANKDIGIYGGETSCGTITVFVLNPLVAPSNVAQEIGINIFMYAGDDFELAVPGTLTPLFLSPPTKSGPGKTHGMYQEYPFVLGSTLVTNFDNKDRIIGCYREGRQLHIMGKLKSDSKSWIESGYAEGYQQDDEVLCWLHECQKLKRYNDKAKPQAKLIAALGAYPEWSLVAQGKEEQVTDRQNVMESTVMTKGKQTSTVAPTTLSENAMNLHTVMKRSYPLFTTEVLHSGSKFTMISIPVNPAFLPVVDDSIIGSQAFFPENTPTNHIAWFSRLYTYWRGSIRYKFVLTGFADVYCFHVPTETMGFQISRGIREVDIQKYLSFASTIAQCNVQNSIEVEVPFFSPYNQCLIDVSRNVYDLRAQNGTLFLAFRANNSTVNDGLSVTALIGAGEDFVLNLFRAAPLVFEYHQLIGSCDESPGEPICVKEVELYKNNGDNSSKMTIPGTTGLKWLNPKGGIGQCTIYVVPGAEEKEEEPLTIQGLEDWFVPASTKARISQLTTQLETTLTSANTVFQNAESLPSSINASLERLNVASDIIKQTVCPANSPTCNFYVDMSVNLMMVFLSVSDCRLFFSDPSISNLMRFAMSFATFLGYNFSSAMKTVLHSVAGWAIDLVLPRAQALNGAIADTIESAEEYIVPVVAVLGTLLYSYIFDCLPSFADLKKSIKSFFEDDDEKKKKPLKAQGKLVSGLKNAHFSVLGFKAIDTIYSKMCDYLKRFLDWILERENPAVIAQRKAGEHQDRILRLISQCDELDYEPTFIQALSDSKVHNRFYKMMQEANDLMDIAVREKIDPKVSVLIKEVRERCRLLIKRLEGENSTSNFRYDPFVVCLSGETGTCKTELMHEISRWIAEELDLPAYNLVYNRTVTKDEFWNGYKNQEIVEWDEFGQNFKDDETVIADFISLRGNAPKQVNMAGLEDKGRNFTSKAIVMTTNVPHERYDKAIRKPEAFLRRRHVLVGCQHRPGTDVQQLQSNETFDATYSMIVYAILDPMAADSPLIEQNMDLYDLKAFIVRKLRTWNNKQENIRISRENEQFNLIMPRGVVATVDPDTPMNIEEPIALPPVAVDEFPADNDEFSDASSMIEDDIANLELIESDDEIVAQAKECKCAGTRFKFALDKDVIMEEIDEFEADLFVNRTENMTCCERAAYYHAAVHQSKPPTIVSKLMTMAKKVFSDLKDKIINFVKDNPRISTVIGLLTMFATSGLLLWNLMKDDKKVEAGTYDGSFKSQAKVRVIAEGGQYSTDGNKVPKTRVVAEGCEDQQGLQIATNVHSNIVSIHWVKGTRATRLIGFHIGGRVILAPYHFFNHAQEGDLFELEHRVKPVPVEFVKDSLIRLKAYDWCLYDCGARLEPRKKMIKYFIPENQLSKIKKLSSMLLSVKQGVQTLQHGTTECTREFLYKDEKYGDCYSQKGWVSKMVTADGDCGSLLIGLSTALQPPGKILGIHVAGRPNQSESYAVLVTKEMLTEAWDLLELKRNQVCGMPITQAIDRNRPLNDAKIIPQGDYSIYGILPNNMCPAQPLKTSFIKTPFYEEAIKIYDCNKKPSNLHPFVHEGEIFSPLKHAIEKYGNVTIPFPFRTTMKIQNFMIDYFNVNLTDHLGKRVFSEQEAIAGIPGIVDFEHMNMKSSPGWPYQVEQKGMLGKWHLFSETNEIIDPTLRQRLSERLAAAKKGERVVSVWRDCLKDELRVKHTTRLFTIPPVDFTIAVRMYFMDFCLAFYRSHLKIWSAVGLNPESLDWTEMYNKLCENGKSTIAGDYKCFDGTAMPEAMELFVNLVNAWYNDTPENQRVRKVLMNEMIHTFHICLNLVYATHQGNKSGNPLTVIKNTVINIYYLMAAWLEIYPDKTLEDFIKFVKAFAYGDDVIATVHPDYPEFNQDNITKFLAKHGIEFTDEAKTGAVTTFRQLDNVTFLKRGFRKDPEFGNLFVLPTMTKETLQAYFFYYRASMDPCGQLQENMRNGLSFAAFHGREFYKEYKDNWTKFMLSKQLAPVSVSFEEQVDIFRCVCGMQMTDSQSLEGSFMSATNHKMSRVVAGVVEAPLYYMCAVLGILQTKDETIVRDDDRFAVAIPSGEGKSYLCKQYPTIFVDHDEKLLPQLKTKRFLADGNPWVAAEARKYDFDHSDRRILLVHHPDNTKRQIIGSFITHFPTFIRVNAIQRLLLKDPIKIKRDRRNILLVQIARDLEPQLFDNDVVVKGPDIK